MQQQQQSKKYEGNVCRESSGVSVRECVLVDKDTVSKSRCGNILVQEVSLSIYRREEQDLGDWVSVLSLNLSVSSRHQR